MFKVDPSLPIPSIDGELDLQKQDLWNRHLGRSLLEGSTFLAARVNGLLPKDGSEAMTGPLLGTSATFTGQLIGGGTTTNDSASAGQIGEFISATLAVGSATALTTGTAKTVTSISLTAGDWEVVGTVGFVTAATTSITLLQQSISQTNNTLDVAPGQFQSRGSAAFVPGASSTNNVLAANVCRVSLNVPTTVYLVASGTFTVSTLTAYGRIDARRAR